MPPSFKETDALSEAGKELLAALDAPGCTTICQRRKGLNLSLWLLDHANETLRGGEANFDLVKMEAIFKKLIGSARTALEALLEKCPDCASLPAGAKELIAEYRKNFKPVVEQENPGQDPEPALA